MKKMSMNKELVDIIVVMAWLLIGIIVGFACGYIYGSVETLRMASEVVGNVLL